MPVMENSRYFHKSNIFPLEGIFFIEIKKFNWSIIALQCCVSFCCTMWISCTYTYIPSLLSLSPTSSDPTPLGHQRALSWAHCDTQQLPTSDLFYTWHCVYVNAAAVLCSVVSDSLTPWTAACQGSFVHGIFQARILEWVAISYSRGSSRPRDRIHVSDITSIGRWYIYIYIYIFYHCATWEAHLYQCY